MPGNQEAAMKRDRGFPLLFLGCASLVLWGSLGAGEGQQDRAPRGIAPPLDLARAEVVDLSHPFDERTLYWPTAPSRFQLTVLHHGPTPGGFFYAANSFCTPEH